MTKKDILQICIFTVVFLAIIVFVSNGNLRNGLLGFFDVVEEPADTYLVGENTAFSEDAIKSSSQDTSLTSDIQNETVSKIQRDVSNSAGSPITPQLSTSFYKNPLNIFSVSYPNDLVYKRDSAGEDLGVSFVGVGSSRPDFADKSITIVLQTDQGPASRHFFQIGSGTDVRFGTNAYKKYTEEHDGYDPVSTYVLPVGDVDGRSVYLFVMEQGFTSEHDSAIATLLASIKVDPLKASIVIQREDNRQTDASIKVAIIQLPALVADYFNSNNTYVGICDGSDSDIQAVVDRVLQNVSSEDLVCLATADSYMYYVHLPGGEVYCVDSNNFRDEVKSPPTASTCE